MAKLDLNPPHGQVGFRELVGQTDRVHIGFLNFGHHLRHPDGDERQNGQIKKQLDQGHTHQSLTRHRKLA